MPRVSEQHLAARRRQIVDAARRCFLREGFHRTTMQDVIAEAGLSVGAVYRYFPSKADLIRAIAEEAVGGAEAVLGELARREPPVPLLEALDSALAYVDSQAGDDGLLRIAIQVWGEAQRDPALGEFVAGKYARVRGHFEILVRRAQRTGEVPADADPEAVAAALFALVPGWFLQRILTGGPDRETYLAGVRTLLSLSPPPPVPPTRG
ncbi:TetR/AcrR family transcriptional regulator [Micromonospora phytophila]|uniref:TetR/AcrR family transcriptional regulator n=1 Tax=Micromonospora phytophila TaxID=709888 RepID=UPI00202EEB3F|nr:TetR/AcrR family transcriptional regulator [Micromonospora phytophila]MCM0677659.1 TetR/AcrR family transcriptional regulator [Micromonospora phytophila]